MTGSNLIFYLFAFASAMGITTVSVKCLIPVLSKKAEQPIYAEGPKWHISKRGTPTMGGLAFVFAVSTVLLGASAYINFRGEKFFASSLLITTLYALANSFIGIIDDFSKIRKKDNAGLTPKQKLILQI